MGSSFQHVAGLSDLDNKLRALPLALQRNILRGGLRAGAVAMQKVVRSNTPVGPANAENVRLYGGREGALRDSVRVGTKQENGRLLAFVFAGGVNPKTGADTFYARWNEYGTAAHLLAPATKKALQISDNAAGFAADNLFFAHAQHPGTKPTHFMSRSFDMGVQPFLNAVVTYISTRIDKELAKDLGS